MCAVSFTQDGYQSAVSIQSRKSCISIESKSLENGEAWIDAGSKHEESSGLEVWLLRVCGWVMRIAPEGMEARRSPIEYISYLSYLEMYL